jgi:GT2 family glycosyltransferase
MTSGRGFAGVTAVVVTHNSASVLPAFLDALPAAFGTIEHELIVADNDSQDGSVEVIRERQPHATVVSSAQNLGYAGGLNAGLELRVMTGPVLVLNPDVRLAPKAVATMLEALAEPGVGIAVPRIIGPDGRTQLSLRRDPTVLRAWGEALLGGHRAGRFAALGEMVCDPASYERACAPDWATGAVMLISPACEAEVGPWDESFFLYSEETDYAIRARAAGFEIRYVPDASAVHLGGESNSSPALWSLLVSNRIRLYRKYHGRWAVAAFSAGVAVNEALRAVAGRPTSRAGLRALAHWTRTTRSRPRSTGTNTHYERSSGD